MSKLKKPNSTPAEDTTKTSVDQVAELTTKLTQVQDQLARAQADYQNLVRRTQEDRLRLINLAGRDVVDRILTPLDHLILAAEQLNDPGLNMVVTQFQQVLSEIGVTIIDPQGASFDPQQMEAAAGSQAGGSRVKQVIARGYSLNGTVLRPAIVVVGGDN